MKFDLRKKASPGYSGGVILTVRARGSDAITLRDAAHEASHALEYGLDEWDRASIDERLSRVKSPRDRFNSEVHARAVEKLVCVHFGVDYDTAGYHAVALLEAGMTNSLPEGMTVELFGRLVDSSCKTKHVEALVTEVLRL